MPAIRLWKLSDGFVDDGYGAICYPSQIISYEKVYRQRQAD